MESDWDGRREREKTSSVEWMGETANNVQRITDLLVQIPMHGGPSVLSSGAVCWQIIRQGMTDSCFQSYSSRVSTMHDVFEVANGILRA